MIEARERRRIAPARTLDRRVADREVSTLKKWEANMMIEVGKIKKARQGLRALHCRTQGSLSTNRDERKEDVMKHGEEKYVGPGQNDDNIHEELSKLAVEGEEEMKSAGTLPPTFLHRILTPRGPTMMSFIHP